MKKLKKLRLSFFNSEDHQAIADFFESANSCLRNCKVVADCDGSCRN